MTNNKKSLREQFSNEIYAKTMKYQKKFGFEIGTRPEHKAWNNEADAFKHTFMQTVLSLRYGDTVSHTLGTWHEIEGDLSNQPKGEKNMDLWNNFIGREIAKEIKQEIKGKEKFFTNEQIEDMAAVKVMERMKKGDLITKPSDKRSFEKLKKGYSTGYAVPFTREQINSMTNDEFSANESSIMSQLKNGLIGSELKDYTGYTNPTSGDNKIFTREDIAQMTTDEYTKYEKDINSQLNSVGIPTKAELSSSSGTVFVNGYTRDDGTEVKSYYRSKPSK